MFRDLNDIRLFAEVARQGAVTRGATALGMPTATVSRRLAAIEREVGERLIERNARHFQLTDTGHAYLAAALRVLEDLDAASAEVSRIVGVPAGPLRMAAPTDFATGFLAEPVAAFAARFPGISVTLDLSPRRVDLIDENVDVAIRMGRLSDSRLVSKRLLTLTRGLYAGPGYLQANAAPEHPEQLIANRLVMLEADLAQRAITLTSENDTCTVSIDASLRVNSVAMLRELTVANAGISLLPDALVSRELADARVVRVLPRWQAPPIEAHLLYRSRALLPQRVRLMVEHLSQWFAGGLEPRAGRRPTP